MSVQAVDRVIAILDSFTAADASLGVNEIARRAGLSKATVHRMLGALQGYRLVEQDSETRRYRLGFKLMQYGGLVIDQLDYGRVAEPHLRRLVEATRETVHLAVLDGGRAYYIAKVEGPRTLRMPSYVGASNPAYCTAVGKALLAFRPSAEIDAAVALQEFRRRTAKTITDAAGLLGNLEQVRAQGYAVDDGELEEALRCVAAPIRDHSGRVVAAVSVSGPMARLPLPGEGGEPDVTGAILETARMISRELGAS